MKLKKILGLTALAAIATFALAACGSSKSSSKDGETTVKVGVMTLSDTEKARWDQVQKNLDDLKQELNWNSLNLQTTHNQIKQLLMVK